jgi:uncharacterized protein (DUF488 family)
MKLGLWKEGNKYFITMMYYRRKILLALLQKLGGNVPATDFQKLLFLFSNKQKVPSFEFVPYYYGCFSFQSYADKRALTHYGMLAEDENRWVIKDPGNYTEMLTKEDNIVLKEVIAEHGEVRGEKLMRYVYLQFPYFAINSRAKKNLLSKNEWDKIEAQKPVARHQCFFTIGYEGRSIDGYLNELVKHGIKTLFDVRKNAFSMKYGFSKAQLKDSIEKLGMEYCHIPELGIDSSDRKELHSQADYDRLFEDYERNVLPKQSRSLHTIAERIKKSEQIALTCFEKDPAQCHRTRIANAIQKMAGTSYLCIEL